MDKGKSYRIFCIFLHISEYVCIFTYILWLSELCSFRGVHDCLVPITPYLATIFEHLREKYSAPSRVRAADIRNILLVLPFILHDLMAEEVHDHNLKHPRDVPMVDPSPELIEVTLQLLSWYHLFRRRNPPKDEDDIVDLRAMAER